MTAAQAIENLEIRIGHLQLDLAAIEEGLARKNLGRAKRAEYLALQASRAEDVEALKLGVAALRRSNP